MTRILEKNIEVLIILIENYIADLFLNSENQLLNHGIKRYLQI